MSFIQYFTSPKHGEIAFTDRREQHHGTRCQPRDIDIVSGPISAAVREEIAIDVRLGQGLPQVGVAKGLLHS